MFRPLPPNFQMTSFFGSPLTVNITLQGLCILLCGIVYLIASSNKGALKKEKKVVEFSSKRQTSLPHCSMENYKNKLGLSCAKLSTA